MVLIIALQVTVLYDHHTCVSTMRVKTKTPSPLVHLLLKERQGDEENLG